MSNKNAEILRKVDNAILALGLSTGGKLTPEQGNKFVSLVFDLSGLTNKVTTARFTSESMKFSKLSLDSRVVYPKTEYVKTGRYSNIATSDVTLTPFRYTTVLKISYEFIEQNIQQGNIQNALLQYFATAIGNDLERFALHGNALGQSQVGSLIDPANGSATDRVKDPLYAKGDAWLKLADSANVYDAANSNNMSLIMAEMQNLMPDQYKSNVARLMYIMPVALQTAYIYQLTSRNTILGDQMQTGKINVSAFGSNVLALPLFDTRPLKVEHQTLTSTTPVSLLYKNIDKDEVWVNNSDLSDTVEETPYVDTTDYVVGEALGTIARSGGSTMPSGEIYKVTYKSPPEMLYTDPANLMIGMNTQDIRIERDVDIEAQVITFVISGSIDAKILNTAALVKAINIKNQLSLT